MRDALAGVLCRCTGYTKIVEAVLAAAAGEVAAAPVAESGKSVGSRAARLDAPAKVRGDELFGADVWPGDPAGVLAMRVIRSPHAHAAFTLGDVAAFLRRWPGVVDVLTAADVPNNAFAIFADLRDQPVLADGVARFRGEAVLALVGDAETLLALPDAELPLSFAPRAAHETTAAAFAAAAAGEALHARYPDNVLCRGRVVAGDVDAALADPTRSARRASASFETRYVEHAYIEPEAGWAEVIEGGAAGAPRRIRVFACTQTPYMDRDEIAHVLAIAPEQVHIVPSAIGGGFGGKLDISVQPLLAVAAWKLGRPVRLVYERPESMQSSTKRHPAQMTATATCAADGTLGAFDFSGDFNTGAYSSWGPTVANRVPIHATGPYRVPHVRALTRAVLTNNSVAGAFRGFGVPQAALLGELLIDELAAQCGADALEFRHRNALRAGDRTPTGQRLEASVGLRECLDALRPAWAAARAAADAFNAEASSAGQPLRRGAGIACMWYGIGNTVIANPSTMRGALRCDAAHGAHLFLYNGAQEIGQGTATIMPQMFADAVGLPLACVHQVMGDTDLTADAGKSSASRQTFVSGNAARAAGRALRRQLLERLDLAGRRRRRGPPRARRLRPGRQRRRHPPSPRPARLAGRRRRRPRFGERPLQPADRAARRRRPGRAVRDLRLRGADGRARGRRRARHGAPAAHPCGARRRPGDQPDPGRRPGPRRHRPGHRHGADGGIRQRPHRQPARLPDPDRRRRAADHGAPDRGPGAARALGRQGRRRAGAGGDGAGDPERDPCRHRRAHARGAGDAESPACRDPASRQRRS